MACQVSHTIFHTGENCGYQPGLLNPLYGDLYAPDDMPINHIISGRYGGCVDQLRVPGAFDVKDMCEGKMNLVALLTDDSPIAMFAAPSDQSFPIW